MREGTGAVQIHAGGKVLHEISESRDAVTGAEETE